MFCCTFEHTIDGASVVRTAESANERQRPSKRIESRNPSGTVDSKEEPRKHTPEFESLGKQERFVSQQVSEELNTAGMIQVEFGRPGLIVEVIIQTLCFPATTPLGCVSQLCPTISSMTPYARAQQAVTLSWPEP